MVQEAKVWSDSIESSVYVFIGASADDLRFHYFSAN